MSTSKLSGWTAKSRADFLDRLFNGLDHKQECLDYGLTVKPLFRPEAYVEGWLKILLPLERFDPPALGSISADGLGNHRLSGWYVETEDAGPGEGIYPKKMKVVRNYLSDLSSRYDEVVLVTGVQSLNAIKIIVPAQIRFQRFYNCNDLFSGECCLSVSDGTLKPVLTVSEWEENPLGGWCLVAHHAPSKNVQRAFEIMDCIAKNKRDFVGNGLLLLDENFALIGVFSKSAPQIKGHSGEERIASNFQIVDMLLGPFNLQTAWVD